MEAKRTGPLPRPVTYTEIETRFLSRVPKLFEAHFLFHDLMHGATQIIYDGGNPSVERFSCTGPHGCLSVAHTRRKNGAAEANGNGKLHRFDIEFSLIVDGGQTRTIGVSYAGDAIGGCFDEKKSTTLKVYGVEQATRATEALVLTDMENLEPTVAVTSDRYGCQEDPFRRDTCPDVTLRREDMQDPPLKLYTVCGLHDKQAMAFHLRLYGANNNGKTAFVRIPKRLKVE